MTQVEKPAQNSGWLQFLPTFVIQRLSGRHNLQAILGNSAWQVADKIVRMGVAVLVGLWVARYLGPHGFGQLNYAIALSSLFGSLANLGLDNVVIRELVKFPERRNVILGSTFVLKLAGALLSLSIVTILVSVLRPGDKAVVLLTFLSAVGYVFQAVSADLYFQSKVQAKYVVMSADGAFLLVALAKVVLNRSTRAARGFRLGRTLRTSACGRISSDRLQPKRPEYMAMEVQPLCDALSIER